MNISNYIKVVRAVIPDDFCKAVVTESLALMHKEGRLEPGMLTDFYPIDEDSVGFDFLNDWLSELLTPHLHEYAREFGINYGKLEYDSYSLTVYCKGTKKELHYDSEILTTDGITGDHCPVSVVIPMSRDSDYWGGLLKFPKQDYCTKLQAGDMLMFPSNFLFPHELTEITEGCRVCLFPYFRLVIPDHKCTEDTLSELRKGNDKTKFSNY